MKPWKIYRFLESGKDAGVIYSTGSHKVYWDFWFPGTLDFIESGFELEMTYNHYRWREVLFPNKLVEQIGPDFPSKEAALQWIYETYFEYFL